MPRTALDQLVHRALKRMPALSIKLKQAGMQESADKFFKRTLMVSLYISLLAMVLLFFLFAKTNIPLWLLAILLPLIYLFIFAYFLKMPDMMMLRVDRSINKEIVFAGRFLVIELESGVPIYNAIINVSKHFPAIGQQFKQIIHKVDMGTTMEEAMEDLIEITPSQNFRKVMWQILNSMKTGSDIALSMNSVIEQISKEQIIEVVEYGRKLNPLAMFYMIIAIIIPTLGITMLIVLSTFISLQLSLSTLLLIVFFLGFIQFMFLSLIKSSRPSVEL